MSHTAFVNVSAYRFVALEENQLETIRADLLTVATQQQLKGTILLSTEGINLFVAGLEEAIEHFFDHLNTHETFKDLPRKDSLSTEQPFTRMLVRIKKEIISMGRNEVMPAKHTAQHLSASEFKQWYDQNKDMVVLDTRNDYEVELGTFKDAIDLNIETFRAFPDAVRELPMDAKNKPVVTFCTGGIRCEKAAEYMLQQGFKEVYQLDGGILKYFEECGSTHYDGECFVFDKRVAVDGNLQETQTTQCYACRMPLHPKEQSGICPHCNGNPMHGKKTEQHPS